MLVLLVAVVTGAWADGIVCTASDLGKVLCTDGSIYENVSAATTAGKTAAAVIVYVDETNKKGLAIALADEGSMNWSTAKSTCEGKTAITGAKWCLPSQDQWEQMFYANGGTTAENTGLNTTITTAGGTPLQENATYWSSSEKSPGVSAWFVKLIYDIVGWGNGSEDNAGYQVRACLAFAPPSYAVTLAEGTEDADKWTIPAEAEEGATVTATYSGTKKVKSVKAVKKAAASLIVNPVVGQIIGSDGINYDANVTLPDGVTKVAMICYVGSETGVAGYTHGLALALSDEAEKMTWSTATGASGAAAHTPAAPTPTTSSWMLPSKDQWDKMIDACKNVLGDKNTYEDLRDGFSGISGASNLQSGRYWSSTEYNAYNAWFYGFDNDSWNYGSMSFTSAQVRACLAF